LNVSRETFGKGFTEMDAGTISELISTVGFPIVCFCACAWYVKYREDKNDEKIDKLNTLHDDESKRMTDALNNNTLALTRLTDTLGKG
jgi:hypothetical protein